MDILVLQEPLQLMKNMENAAMEIVHKLNFLHCPEHGVLDKVSEDFEGRILVFSTLILQSFSNYLQENFQNKKTQLEVTYQKKSSESEKEILQAG